MHRTFILYFTVLAIQGAYSVNVFASDKVAIPEPADDDKRRFFKDLLAATRMSAEKSILQQQRQFAFDTTALASLCRQRDRVDCERLVAKIDLQISQSNTDFPVAFNELHEVTALVNKTIRRFNVVITSLTARNIVVEEQRRAALAAQRRGEISKYDYELMEEELAKETLSLAQGFYDDYFQIFLKASELGIMPIFFTEIFHKKSGSIHLPSLHQPDTTMLQLWHGLNCIFSCKAPSLQERKLLIQVTNQTVAQAIVEGKRDLVRYWVKLQDVSRKEKLPCDQAIYRWVAANSMIVADLMHQDHTYEAVSAFFIDRFSDRSRLPWLLDKLGDISPFLTLFTVGLLFYANIAALPASVAFFTLVGSVAVNYIDIGLGVFSWQVVRSELFIREQSLIVDASQQIETYLELKRAYEKLTQQTLVSVSAGFVLTTISVQHLIKNQNDIPFLLDFISGITSIVDFEQATDANLAE